MKINFQFVTVLGSVGINLAAANCTGGTDTLPRPDHFKTWDCHPSQLVNHKLYQAQISWSLLARDAIWNVKRGLLHTLIEKRILTFVEIQMPNMPLAGVPMS